MNPRFHGKFIHSRNLVGQIWMSVWRCLWIGVVLSWSVARAAEDAERGLAVKRVILPTAKPQQNVHGHPKLVALLVGEDYSRERPEWQNEKLYAPLPGVWQDLARVKATLEALGFGRVEVLTPGGQAREVQVENGRSVSFAANGGSRNAGSVKTCAEALGQQLLDSRSAKDANGQNVRPLFVFYYSGHGSVDAKGVHRLPLAEDRDSDTAHLVKEVLDKVGAHSEDRGGAGGGTAMVVFDCCQAGAAVNQSAGAKGAAAGGSGNGDNETLAMLRGLTESMPRVGVFYLGASLREQSANENAGGGRFTQSLCRWLNPDALGVALPKSEWLSLEDLAGQVDDELQKSSAQVMTRWPPAYSTPWGWPLFLNPHYRRARQVTLTLSVDPAAAELRVQQGTAWVLPERLTPPWPLTRDKGLLTAQLAEPWPGQTVRLKAVPVRPEDLAAGCEESPAREVKLHEQGEQSEAFACRWKAGDAGGELSVEIASLHARMKEAKAKESPLERWRALVATRKLAESLKDQTDREIELPYIDKQISECRTAAGEEELGLRLARATALVGNERWLEALNSLKGAGEGLDDFGLAAAQTAARIELCRTGVLSAWNDWAAQARQAEAERLVAEAERLLPARPWESWTLAYKADVFAPGERARGVQLKAVENCADQMLSGKVGLTQLVGALGVVKELGKGEGIQQTRLRAALPALHCPYEELDQRLQQIVAEVKSSKGVLFPDGGGGQAQTARAAAKSVQAPQAKRFGVLYPLWSSQEEVTRPLASLAHPGQATVKTAQTIDARVPPVSEGGGVRTVADGLFLCYLVFILVVVGLLVWLICGTLRGGG